MKNFISEHDQESKILDKKNISSDDIQISERETTLSDDAQKSKISDKRGDFDSAVSKSIGEEYDKRLKKKEKSGLFHYVLKQLGLRK